MKEQLVLLKTFNLALSKGFKNHICILDEWINLDSIPTQSLLQRWLREKHNIKLAILFRENISSGIESWDWLIKGTEVVYRQYKTYELALEAGLLEGLKLIK